MAGTPAVGDIIVLVTCYTGIATSIAPTDNNPDGHGTYTQLTSALKNTSADFLGIWIRADAIQRAVSTTFSIAPGGSSGGGLQVYKITGMTISALAARRGSGAVSNGAALGTPAITFAQAALTTNPIIVALFNATNPSGVTGPAGFTTGLGTGYATPTTGYLSSFVSSGATPTTITWGSSSASAFCACGAELRADAGQTAIFPPRGSGPADITMSDSPKLRAVRDGARY